MAKDKSLQEARQAWVLDEIANLKLVSPVAELHSKLGYGMSLISEVINKKAAVSLKFFQTFCDVYGFNWEAVNGMLIEQIQRGIKEAQVDNKTNSSKEKNDTSTYTEKQKSLASLLNNNPLHMNDSDFIKYLAVELMTAHKDLISRIDGVKLKEEVHLKDKAM